MRLTLAELEAIQRQTGSTLDLSNRNLGLSEDMAGLQEVCASIGQNQHLTTLILSHNTLDNRCIPLLLQLKQLQRLCIDHNDLNDDCVQQLAESQLKSLDISHNNLTGAGIQRLMQYTRQEFISAAGPKIPPAILQELTNFLRERQKQKMSCA